MKITKSKLMQIVKEEMQDMLREKGPPTLKMASTKKGGKATLRMDKSEIEGTVETGKSPKDTRLGIGGKTKIPGGQVRGSADTGGAYDVGATKKFGDIALGGGVKGKVGEVPQGELSVKTPAGKHGAQLAGSVRTRGKVPTGGNVNLRNIQLPGDTGALSLGGGYDKDKGASGRVAWTSPSKKHGVSLTGTKDQPVGLGYTYRFGGPSEGLVFAKSKLERIIREEYEALLRETGKVDTATTAVSGVASRMGSPDEVAEWFLKLADVAGLPDDNAKMAAMEMTMNALAARVEQNRQEREIQAAQGQPA